MAKYLPKKCGHAECDTEETSKNENKLKPQPVKNDRRLQRWEDLMRTRKQVHAALGGDLGRDPGELLMNASEELRSVREEKMVLEYSRIADPPDKQRGCPGFWTLPEELTNKFDNSERSYCFVQKSHEEKCLVPTIPLVGVPNRILEEKDVLPRTRNVYGIWRNMQYKQFKAVEMDYRIKHIKPHKPIMEDLIIIGSKIQKPSQETEKPEKICESQQDLHDEQETLQCKNATKQVSIVIGCIPINSDSPSNQLYLAFDNYDTTANKLVTKYIELYNNGSKTLRIYWKRAHLRKLFEDILSQPKETSPFTFDKSELLVLPGHKVLFPFWFKTKKPGTYSETWEILMLPTIMPETSHFYVKLTGVACLLNLHNRCRHIRQFLDEKVRENLIKETLSEVINRATTEKEPEMYFYDKSNMFEAMNPRNKFDDRPLYLYDEEVVNKLANIYKIVRQEDHPEKWNLSVEELRGLVLKYDEMGMRKLGEIHEEESAVPLKFEPMRAEFESLVQKLKKAGVLTDTRQRLILHQTVYSVLSSHIGKICDEVDSLEKTMGLKINKIYPRNVKNDYKPYVSPDEFIDDLTVPGFSTELEWIPHARPPPECLKDIPLEDCEQRYRAYHGLDGKPKAESKGEKEKGKKEKGKKEKGKKEKGKKEKGNKEIAKKGKKEPGAQKSETPSTMQKPRTESIIFEPYLEVENKVSSHSSLGQLPELSSESLLPVIYPKSILEQYSFSLYVIFYRNLCMATEAIETVLEENKERQLPPAALRRIQDCEDWPRRKNLLAYLTSVLPDIIVDGESDDSSYSSASLSPNISLQDVLNAYTSKTEFNSGRPISYPQRTILPERSSTDSLSLLRNNISTSTLEHGVLDPNWEDFKDKELQTEEEDETDLVAKIEHLHVETSAEELFLKKSVSCQKNEDEYVSDEEYFFKSIENIGDAK